MNTKKIILLSTIVILGSLFLGQVALAASPALSVLPATASKNVGTAFNVSVQLDTQGNKVCVVKGTLNFNNLTCRSVTVTSGLIAQTTPTCSSPSFVIGIPKCTTVNQNILTVSVKGNSVGQAATSIVSGKVIGVGAEIAFSTNAGAYSITAVPSQVVEPETTTPPATEELVIQPEPAPVAKTDSGAEIPSNVAAASLSSMFGNFFQSPIGYIIIIIILMLIALWSYDKFFSKKNKK